MGKLRINKHDSDRVILTETQPYEVPVTFSNDGFYLNLKEKSLAFQELISALEKIKGDTIPLNYKIKKDFEGKRTLSLPHPTIQLKLKKFYSDYDSLIISLCNRSLFSLRHPSKVASYFYEKDLASDTTKEKASGVEEDNDGFSPQSSYASSYFSYKKFSLLYKFYESYEHHRLEKRFEHLLRFDIAKCFDSIYTHSIAWAVKDKSFAKDHRGFSFEDQFDRILRSGNHGETNGIMIGPEVSRIFAEIILQRIDHQVTLKLSGMGLHHNKDYAVRRYVDDYFIFSTHRDNCDTIFNIFRSSLEEFKLHINPSKTEHYTSPFITTISAAKNDLKSEIEDHFEKILNSKTKINTSQNSNKLIQKIKQISLAHTASYSATSGVILSTIKKSVETAIEFSEENEFEHIFQTLFIAIEASFFTLTMSPRVRSTYLTTHICAIALRASKNLSYDQEQNIQKKIFDESILILEKINSKRSYEKDTTIETLNILTLISMLDDDYRLSPEKLENIILGATGDLEIEDIGYFESCSLLHYIKDHPEYSEIRNSICRSIEFRTSQKEFTANSSTIHLALDAISCPYIETTIRIKILQALRSNLNLSKLASTDANSHITELSKNGWFTNWNPNLNFENILLKKSLKYVY